jgi:hypothetical protein
VPCPLSLPSCASLQSCSCSLSLSLSLSLSSSLSLSLSLSFARARSRAQSHCYTHLPLSRQRSELVTLSACTRTHSTTSTHLLVTLTHSASHSHTHPSPTFTQICGHIRIDHGNVHIPPRRLSCRCDHTHPSSLEGVSTRTVVTLTHSHSNLWPHSHRSWQRAHPSSSTFMSM